MCFQLALEYDEGLQRRNERVMRRFASWKNPRTIYHANAFTKPMHPVFTLEAPDVVTELRWGLVPIWAKDPDEFLKKASTYNAVSVAPAKEGEKPTTVYDKPSFRNAMGKEHRCLIPATGFFEWHHLGKQTFPHYIRVKSRELFCMAGIYENGTFSLLTTEANPLMAHIHNTKKRMPVILTEEQEALWLTKGLSQADVLALCKPYPDDDMEAWPVSRLLTDRARDSNVPEVHERVEYAELGMFS